MLLVLLDRAAAALAPPVGYRVASHPV